MTRLTYTARASCARASPCPLAANMTAAPGRRAHVGERVQYNALVNTTRKHDTPRPLQHCSTEANTQFHDQTLSVRTGGTLPRYLYTGSTKNERTHCLTVDTTATHPEHVRVTSEFRHARRAGARLSLRRGRRGRARRPRGKPRGGSAEGARRPATAGSAETPGGRRHRIELRAVGT